MHFHEHKTRKYQKTCKICGWFSQMWGSFLATGCLHMFGRRTVWGSGCTEGSSGSCGHIWYLLLQRTVIRKSVIKPWTTSVASLTLVFVLVRSENAERMRTTHFDIDSEALSDVTYWSLSVQVQRKPLDWRIWIRSTMDPWLHDSL